MRLRPATIVLAVAMVVAAAAVSIFRLTPFALRSVEVSVPSCVVDMESTGTTISSAWAGSTLFLTIKEPENCAYELHSARIQRFGSHLFVRTRYHSPSGMATGCHCVHTTEARISGIPKRDYRVHVYSWP